MYKQQVGHLVFPFFFTSTQPYFAEILEYQPREEEKTGDSPTFPLSPSSATLLTSLWAPPGGIANMMAPGVAHNHLV